MAQTETFLLPCAGTLAFAASGIAVTAPVEPDRLPPATDATVPE